MQLFIIFIFGAIILGSGAMFSPAWPTRQPRIALAAALCLALVLGGAVFWAELFGWDTLVIDYLLFALMSGVVLGGTLSSAQARAEAKGETLSDAEQGWPNALDLGFFALIGLVYALWTVLYPVPFGQGDAQTTAYLALVAREGGTFNTLAPFQPEVSVLYPPGFQALTAYLSQQLGQPIPTIQMVVSAVVAALIPWLAYDLGAEIRDKRLGRALAAAVLLSVGTANLFLSGQYTVVVALFFALAFWLYGLRYLRHGLPIDAIAAGLMLGAILLTHLGVFVLMLLGWLLWAMVAPFTLENRLNRLNGGQWAALMGGVPLVALLATAPWWLKHASLLAEGVVMGEAANLAHLGHLVSAHSLLMLVLVPLGVWVGWQSREMRPLVVLALGWLALVAFFAVGAVPLLGRFVDPLQVTFYGPVIAYALLGGIALLGLWDELARRQPRRLQMATIPIFSTLPVLMLIMAAFYGPLSGDAPELDEDALRVLLWLRDNAPAEATIISEPALNGWTLPFTERASPDSVLKLPGLMYPPGAELTAAPTPDEPAMTYQVWRGTDANAINDGDLRFARGDVRVYGPDTNEPSTSSR